MLETRIYEETKRTLKPQVEPEKSYCQILIIEKSKRKLCQVLWKEIGIEVS